MVANRRVENERPDNLKAGENNSSLFVVPSKLQRETSEIVDPVVAFREAFEQVVLEDEGIQSTRGQLTSIESELGNLRQQHLVAVKSNRVTADLGQAVTLPIHHYIAAPPKGLLARFTSSPAKRLEQAKTLRDGRKSPIVERGRQQAAQIKQLEGEMHIVAERAAQLRANEQEQRIRIVLQDPQLRQVALFAAAYLSGPLHTRERSALFRQASERYEKTDDARRAMESVYQDLVKPSQNGTGNNERSGVKVKTVGIADPNRTEQLVHAVEKEDEPRFAMPVFRIKEETVSGQKIWKLRLMEEGQIDEFIEDRARSIAKDSGEVLISSIDQALQDITRDPSLFAPGVRSIRGDNNLVTITLEDRSHATLKLRRLDLGKRPNLSISRAEANDIRIVFGLLKNGETRFVLEGIYSHEEFMKKFGGSIGKR